MGVKVFLIREFTEKGSVGFMACGAKGESQKIMESE